MKLTGLVSAYPPFEGEALFSGPGFADRDGSYAGRLQQGADLAPAAYLPGSTSAPVVRAYDPATGELVWAGELTVLEDPGVAGVFTRTVPLGPAWPPGRYALVYQGDPGLALVEVAPGGDPAGPLIVVVAATRPDATVVLAQAGSGRILLGRDPYSDEGIS